MRKMSKEKKNVDDYKGMRVTQNSDKAEFIKEYRNWKKTCMGISNSDMMVSSRIPTLYDFLVNHITSTNVRDNSRNKGFTDEGANKKYIAFIERVIENKYYTLADEIAISSLGDALMALKGTGEDAGGDGKALDPAFILFTDVEEVRGNERLAPKPVQGHYRTEKYKEKYGGEAAPADWFTGSNLPHKALFNEKPTADFDSRGLAVMMMDAKGKLAQITNEVDDVPMTEDDDTIVDWEEIGEIERYFDKAIKNTAFWNKDGKLNVAKLRRDFENTKFKLGNTDRRLVREIAQLDAKDAPAGKITEITLSATPKGIVILIERALRRKTPRGVALAPNDKPAWQNTVRGGFDFREEGQEEVVFPVNSVRMAKELAKIPEIKRFAQGLLKKTELYDGANFNTSQAAARLSERKFDFPPSSKQKVLDLFRKEKSNPKTIQVKLTKNAMKALLNQSVISRTRDLQSMNAPNTDERIVLKRMWQSYLWR